MSGTASSPESCDVVVIGGGIVGLAVARELLARRPGNEVCVLEGADRIATGQTGQTSGVVHAGIYYRPGSLKAELCARGAAELYVYCDGRGIEARRSGKLIVATAERELPALDELERRGRENGVPGLRRLGAADIAQIEPHARGVAALHSPATGVVDFAAVAAAFAEDVREGGGAVATGCPVRELAPGRDRVEVVHERGTTAARVAVNCAGSAAARIATGAGAPRWPQLVPVRGAYLRLSPDRRELVRANIYPVPDPELPFLGAHLTRTIDDQVLLGPTALLIGGFASPATWRLAARQWRTGMRELLHAASRRSYVREAARLVPDLRARDVAPGPAGVRAQAIDRDGTLIDDFVLHETERAVHLRNAPSPAATSALPLARLIADRVDAVGAK